MYSSALPITSAPWPDGDALDLLRLRGARRRHELDRRAAWQRPDLKAGAADRLDRQVVLLKALRWFADV